MTKASASVVCPAAPVVKARVCDMVGADRNNKFREAQTPVPDADAIPRNTGVALLGRGAAAGDLACKICDSARLAAPE